MQQTVAILGGGVAGLTAAQELAERGFQVRVYERKSVMGGKARSIPVPNSGVGGRQPLPGEHGFRFFPGFYKHVTVQAFYTTKPTGVGMGLAISRSIVEADGGKIRVVSNGGHGATFEFMLPVRVVRDSDA